MLLAWALYTVYAAALFWPIVRAPRTTLIGHGDLYGRVWLTWMERYHPPVDGLTFLQGFPFGHDVGHGRREALSRGVVNALAGRVGEVAALNLLWLIALPLNALAAMMLGYYVTRDSGAAFFTGLTFGFGPVTIMHGLAGHTPFLFALWLPLAALAVLLVVERGSIIWGVALGVVMAGALASYIIFAFLAALLIGVLLLLHACAPRSGRMTWVARRAGALAAAIVVGGAMALPSEGASVQRLVTNPAAYTFASIEAFAQSARPWNYVMPPLDHPLLGAITDRFAWLERFGGTAAENTLFLGFLPLGLAAAGFVLFARSGAAGADSPLRRRHFWVFAAIAAVFVILSAPPFLPVGARTLWLPSYVFVLTAPVFRAYARFGIVVLLAVALMAGLSVAVLRSRMPPARRNALVAMACAVVTVEFWSVPWRFATTLETPPVYAWLAAQPGAFGVAEYPIADPGSFRHYRYLFWQRVHAKPLVNGGGAGLRDAEFLRLVQDVGARSTPGLLRQLGVAYVVIHADAYRQGPIPERDKRYNGGVFNRINCAAFNAGTAPEPAPGLTLIDRFGDTAIYRVDATPPPFVVLAPGSRPWDTLEIHSRWVVFQNDATLSVENLTSTARQADVRLIARSMTTEPVRVESDGRRIADLTVGPSAGAVGLTVPLPPAPGAATLTLTRGAAHAFEPLVISLSDAPVKTGEDLTTFEAEGAPCVLGRRVLDEGASAHASVVAGAQPAGFPLFFGPTVTIPPGAYRALFRIKQSRDASAADSSVTLMVADVSRATKVAVRTLDRFALEALPREEWADIGLAFSATASGRYDFRVIPGPRTSLSVDVVRLLPMTATAGHGQT